MGMTDGEHIDMDGPETFENVHRPDLKPIEQEFVEEKCIHRLDMKGHGKTWCVVFHKEANCGSCVIFPKYRQQAEDRCHRKGQHNHIHYVHTGGTLRDAVGSKADRPVFTKHHETIMKRNKAEKMKMMHAIYGGLDEYIDRTPYEKYIRILKDNIRVAENRSRMQRMVAGWWKNDVTVAMQERVAHADYSKLEARLLARAGVTLLHDEFLIDQGRWVSPFTEGELVRHKGKLARVIKITGPVVKIRLQQRDYPKHLDVMDWELEKRSCWRWVKKQIKKHFGGEPEVENCRW